VSEDFGYAGSISGVIHILLDQTWFPARPHAWIYFMWKTRLEEGTDGKEGKFTCLHLSAKCAYDRARMNACDLGAPLGLVIQGQVLDLEVPYSHMKHIKMCSEPACMYIEAPSTT